MPWGGFTWGGSSWGNSGVDRFPINFTEGVFQPQQESIDAKAISIAAVAGDIQHEINPWTLIQFGTLFSADQAADNAIVLSFSSAIDLNDPYLVPSSYNIQESDGYPVTVFSVQLVSATSVRLIVTFGTDGSIYQAQITGALHLQSGTDLQGSSASYEADVSRPTVTDAISTSPTTVLVTFDRVMTLDADLLNPAKYSFDNGLVAHSITTVATNQVEVVTGQQESDLVYELTVTP